MDSSYPAALNDSSFVGICGDVHGHLQLALIAWALEMQATNCQLDAILLCGDVGTFTPDCPPDRATLRHATENPCELEFLDWAVTPPAPWLDGIFSSLASGGLGLEAPVIMVTGNHEGFDWIDLLVQDIPSPPSTPVLASNLPAVDSNGRIRLLPSGWRVKTPAGRIIAGVGGIQPGQRPGAEYPDTAYINDQGIAALYGKPQIDIFISHQGPARVQGTSSGSTALDRVLDDPCPLTWFHGHSRKRHEQMTIGGCTVYPLGDATFDVNGRPRLDGWATVTGPPGAPIVTVKPPCRLNELHRRSWIPVTETSLVAPHLGAWIQG